MVAGGKGHSVKNVRDDEGRTGDDRSWAKGKYDTGAE